ncbi:MAG: DUF6691 family protein [Alphaproteobacteria bacterium]
MELLLAITLGLVFGFALNRVGLTNPQNIINILRLRHLWLMKAILLAIGVTTVSLFAGLALGLIDPSHLSVKSSYLGVVAGGAIFGAGFALAGYCPGSGLAALASGRRNALFFVFGGLAGAFVYTISYGWLKAHTPLFDTFAGGKVTLAQTGNEEYSHLIESIDGTLLGIILGTVFIVIALILPKEIKKS